jgi:hypothetical protein
MAGHGGHFIDVLMLVLHGGAHGSVSHDIHDREQVFWLHDTSPFRSRVVRSREPDLRATPE